MGSKKGIVLSALVALLLIVPASASANVEVSVTPTAIDMGEVPAKTTKTETVTLTSTGTDPAWINDLSIRTPDGSYPFSPPFTFSQTEPCNEENALSQGQSCEIQVSFTPKNSSNHTYNLWLVGNFASLQVRLTGSGSNPQAEVTPSLNFGEKLIGRSATRTASITASELTPISVDSAAISGPGASSYSLEYDAGKCQNLGFQQSCDFEVTFSPTEAGSHKADLVVTGNFGSKTISLSGSARKQTPPRLDIRAFGPRRAAPGGTVTLKAKIYNRGETVATNAVLKTFVPKSLAAKVKPIKIASIAAGKPVTKTIRIKVKRSSLDGNLLKVSLKVSAKSAKTGETFRSIRIR